VTAEERIATILDAPVFSGELYPVQVPDKDAARLATAGTSYGVYTKVGGEAPVLLSGEGNIARPRIQVSVYATTNAQLKALESAVNVAMKAANVLANDTIEAGNDPYAVATALLNNPASVPIDGFEQATRRYYCHMDFYAWVKE
jgi:hypothetical protein